MAEYRITLAEAVFEFPLRAALALWPAIAYRNGGGTSGPDKADLASIRARNKAQAFFEKFFRIVD